MLITGCCSKCGGSVIPDWDDAGDPYRRCLQCGADYYQVAQQQPVQLVQPARQLRYA